MANPTCDPPSGIQLAIGLVAVALVLLVIERVAPEYATLYILIVILGLVLAHADCFVAFAGAVAALGGQSNE